ncbi:MAG: hypothetical protein MJ080_00760, partial [Clostridia bacterium]|nr:hypothetical protein [Clostridia bacterium]
FYSSAKDTTEAVQEAAWVDALLKEQKKKGINIVYPVAYDFEEFGSHSTSRANGLSKAQVTDDAVAFLDYLKSKDYKVLHYSCKAWMTSNWDAAKLKKYDFWLAQYCTAANYNGSYVMWQYTSQGKVDGIKGDVDLDISGIKSSENEGRASFAVCAKDEVLAYEKPNASSKVLYHLSGDTIYECLKTYEKDWSELYIYPDGQEKGIYVYVKDTDIKEPEFLTNDNEYETTEKISYYSKAIDKKANIVGEIEKDTKLNVLGVYKKLWLKIEYNNNTYYVKFLNIKETEKQTESPDTPPETIDNPPETETTKKEVE